MSDATKLELERALIAHVNDEQFLEDGDLISEFLLIAAAMPAERTYDTDSMILVVTSQGLPNHHGEGLAWAYLHLPSDSR